nr:hypothetical protein [Tanacetum cinerariifolium]
ANLSTHPSKSLNSFCYDDDDEEDYTIAVTPSLSIEEPDNSLSMGDEHLDTILVTKSDEVINSSVENLIPILNDILRENLLNVNHLFAKIEALNDIPTPLYDPIVSGTPPTLTPSEESDFFLEELDAFLAVEDKPTSS